jgi:hypothetical protein
MKKFLIESSHGPEKKSCAEAIQVFLQTGNHLLTHAEWGCADGEHKAWIIVEAESKEEAMYVLPLLPYYRPTAKIIQLVNFTLKERYSSGE